MLTEDRLIKAVTVEDNEMVNVQIHPGIDAPNARRPDGGLERDLKGLKDYADNVLDAWLLLVSVLGETEMLKYNI